MLHTESQGARRLQGMRRALSDLVLKHLYGYDYGSSDKLRNYLKYIPSQHSWPWTTHNTAAALMTRILLTRSA